jgi:hypothetical protein
MKRLGKVFLGVLCMILLFAFSHASDDNICAPNIELEVVETNYKVTFAWKEAKTYCPAKPGMKEIPIDDQNVEVKYVVYRYQAENKDENPPTEAQFEEYKKQNRLKEYPQIIKNSMVIKFENNGLYLLGVRAKPFNKKNGSEIKGRSDVSWSCYKKCTIKPQKVVFTRKK